MLPLTGTGAAPAGRSIAESAVVSSACPRAALEEYWSPLSRVLNSCANSQNSIEAVVSFAFDLRLQIISLLHYTISCTRHDIPLNQISALSVSLARFSHLVPPRVLRPPAPRWHFLIEQDPPTREAAFLLARQPASLPACLLVRFKSHCVKFDKSMRILIQ